MALHIYLRPAEGAAVGSFFDVEKAGSVNGECFVRWFLKAGLDSREVTSWVPAFTMPQSCGPIDQTKEPKAIKLRGGGWFMSERKHVPPRKTTSGGLVGLQLRQQLANRQRPCPRCRANLLLGGDPCRRW